MEYGWWSLLPPVIAIVLAILTRQVIVSLGVAIVVGALQLSWLEPGWSDFFKSLFVEHLWFQFWNTSHLQVFLFSVTLGAMVGIIEAIGGMESLARSLMRRVRTRRGGQLLVWGFGLGVFFDDYANTLLLGSTMRSAADRLRFSRAKLAYLVDSTAAPVAGLALVSTWVATEISLIGEGMQQAGIASTTTPFAVFLASVPTRTYAILALVMVAAVAITKRDFGPMLREEQLRWSQPSSVAADEEDATDSPWLWWTAVLPVAVCVGVIAVVLVQTGTQSVGESELSGLRYWGEVVGNADSYIALVIGSCAGFACAILASLAAIYGQQTKRRGSAIFWGSLRGAFQILPAMLILWLAWTLSGMTEGASYEDGELVRGPFLDTGGFISATLDDANLAAWFLPTAVFIAAGFVALSTGTSWGTMALLTPLSVQLAVAAGRAEGADVTDGGPYLIAVVGAVLAGAIFGDHCSPISDTTVLSSRASGCDHILHVRTQLPYAIYVGAITLAVGTIPSGFGISPWISIPTGSVLIFAGLLLFGRNAESDLSAESSSSLEF